MNLAERIFAIKHHQLFSALRDSELAVVGEIARHRKVPPTRVVWRSGKPALHLFLLVEGELFLGETPCDSKMILRSLLEATPLAQDLHAGPRGCELLVIGKGHFFTMLHECPGLAYQMVASFFPGSEMAGGDS
jgi:CRP-like cAMP-binding protein